MQARNGYGAEALGLTTEGNPLRPATPTEGFCSASFGAGRLGAGSASSREAEPGPEGVRRAQRASAPAGRVFLASSDAQRLPAGEGVSPPAKSQSGSAGRERAAGVAPGLRALDATCPNGSPKATGRATPSAGTPPTRLLACRCDALVLAFKVNAPVGVEDEFDERQALSDLAGAAELKLDGLPFHLVRNRSQDRFHFQNADVRCLYDRRASGGWNLEVVVRAAFLATHRLSDSFALAWRIAWAVGRVDQCRGRRVDLCADYSGFPLDRGDAERLATKRSRIDGFLVEPKDLDEAGAHAAEVREHLSSAKRVTGFTIAPGNCLMARIYDKTAELKLSGREEKRTIEEELWRRSGWELGERVTRVELQVRGTALDEFGVRDPAKLAASLDSVWQHGVVNWLRLVEPASASRPSRCRLDHRWEAVVSTVFEHPAEPARRERTRGGASVENVLGTVASRLGGSGKIPRGLALSPDVVKAMDPTDQEAWFRRTLSALFDAAGRDAFETLVQKHGLNAAALKLAAKLAATQARFWSIDDLTEDWPDDIKPVGPHE